MTVRQVSAATEQRRMAEASKRTYSISMLRHRDFRLLWSGQAISRLGDQFYLIALPWLVLQVTGSAMSMGTVMALEGTPRALFMLAGGAIADRFSARAVLLGTYTARFVVVGSLALLVALSTVTTPVFYAAALLFGLADAFHLPAQAAIIPDGVTKEQLDAVTVLNQTASHMTMAFGPMVAGTSIVLLAGRGTGFALAVDALSFAAGAWLVARVRVSPRVDTARSGRPGQVLRAMGEAVSYVWHVPRLRQAMLLFAAVSFLVDGPFDIAAPVLAHSRYSYGAAAFGGIASAFAGGLLIGTGLAGMGPRLRYRWCGTPLLAVSATLGISTTALGIAPSVWIAAPIAVLMGAADGYVVLVLITWIQHHTPDEMMGRMMSILMLLSVGLNPLSTALAGALASFNLAALLAGSGTALTAMVLLGALFARNHRNPANRLHRRCA